MKDRVWPREKRYKMIKSVRKYSGTAIAYIPTFSIAFCTFPFSIGFYCYQIGLPPKLSLSTAGICTRSSRATYTEEYELAAYQPLRWNNGNRLSIGKTDTTMVHRIAWI